MRIPVPVSVAVLAALTLLVLWLMARSWRRRGDRTTAVVPALPAVPTTVGDEILAPVDVVYVASTVARSWLERIGAHGLGVRSRGTAQVGSAGLLVLRDGATDLFIPASRVRGTVRSSGMVGKFVGDQSIVVVTWQPGDAPDVLVDTGLRPVHELDRDRLQAAISSLSSTPTADSTIEPKEQK